MNAVKYTMNMLLQTSVEWADANFLIASSVRCCKGEYVSGDEVLAISNQEFGLFAVIDGLGHGSSASEIAQQLKTYLEEHQYNDISVIIQKAHEKFMGSRGAVIGLAKIFNNGDFEYIGIGNVRAYVIGDKERVELVSGDGALGVRIRNSFFHQRLKMKAGDRFIMYSDGVSSRMFRDNIPLPRNAAKVFVDSVIEKYGKDHDDASILYVVKQEEL